MKVQHLAGLIVPLALAAPAAAHVGLDAPNGGEVVQPGDVVSVDWHVVIAHNTENWDLWYSTTGAGGPWIPMAVDLPPRGIATGDAHSFDWIVPDAPSSNVYVRVRMDNFTGTDYEDISDGALTISSCGVTSYCVGGTNSTGVAATMAGLGSVSVAQNTFTLEATNAVPNEPGLFFYGNVQAQSPFGNGFRCVGQPLYRLFPPAISDGSGRATYALDMSSPPQAAAQITPDSTWNFQYWFRDPLDAFAFNLTDGIAVTFCP